MIQVSELHFSTDDGIKVLDDVHLHVDQGDLVYLYGPPLSGKSLLLGLLSAHIPPQRGQILVNGRNVTRLSRQKTLSLQRRIGLLPQGFVPLPRTVIGNLTFKLRLLGNFQEQAEEKALFALETCALLHQQGEDAEALSSADRLRLGIALALCDDPLLVLLDDPLDGLDPEQQGQICQLLRRLNTVGRTVLVTGRVTMPPLSAEHELMLSEGAVIPT